MKNDFNWGYGISDNNYNLKKINIEDLNLGFIENSLKHCKKIINLESTNIELESIHKIVPQSLQIPDSGNVNAITCMISKESIPSMYKEYLKLVLFLSKNIFNEDLIFEKSPFLRFHFPQKLPDRYRLKNGKISSFHSDMMLGDYKKQYNCWLSVSSTFSTNSLQVIELQNSCTLIRNFINNYKLSENDFYQSRKLFYNFINENEHICKFIENNSFPFNTKRSELIIFDPAIIHGTAENIEAQTRVSLDFRVIKVSDFKNILDNHKINRDPFREFGGMKYLPGEYYHLNSISEVII